LTRWGVPSDLIARYDQFHTPVLLPSGRGGVVGDWLRLTEAYRGNVIHRDTLLHEVIPN
jgi:hypothetical protein